MNILELKYQVSTYSYFRIREDSSDDGDKVSALSKKLSTQSLQGLVGSNRKIASSSTDIDYSIADGAIVGISALPTLNSLTRKNSDSIRSRSSRSNASATTARMLAGCNPGNLPAVVSAPRTDSTAYTVTSASVTNPIIMSHKSGELSHHSISDAHTKSNTNANAGVGNMEGLNFFNGVNSLRLNTGNLRTAHLGTMMSVIQDPVQCGFLLQFCTKQHNSENLCFIMMVSRFRDAMSTDAKSWPKTWTQVDAELLLNSNKGAPIDPEDTSWPSTVLSKVAISKLVQSIWDNFLSNDAPHQICMPSQVAENTRRRIRFLDLYGPEVYTEALLDPIKTMHKDVLPRFLASPLYADMKLRLASLMQRSMANKLVVPPPDKMSSLDKKSDLFHEKRLFSLQEILENRVLYTEFLSHLQKKMSVENLLCYRMILIFEERIAAMDVADSGRETSERCNESLKAEAINQAWVIYRYFVAPDAPYEVSLHSRHKKELMISLAYPYKAMFEELKKSTYSVLTVNFNAFKFTDEYRHLWKTLRDARLGGGFSALVGGLTGALPNILRVGKKPAGANEPQE